MPITVTMPLPHMSSSRPRHQHKPRDPVRPVDRKELEVLPSMDRMAYYHPMSPGATSSSDDSDGDSDIQFPENLPTNSNNKSHPSARFTRHGKMYAWGSAFEEYRTDHRVRKRMKRCLEQFLPDAATEVGQSQPDNILKAESKREAKRRKKEEDEVYHLPHLRSPSPPVSTRKLAPMLALPQSYIDIMISPAMRHSLGDDTVEVGLQRTTTELLEGEKGLMQACGRLREIVRMRAWDVLDEKARGVIETEKTKANIDAEAANGDADGDAKMDGSPTPDGLGDANKTDPTTSTTVNGTSAPTDQPPATSDPINPLANNGESSTAMPNGIEKIPPLPHLSDTDNLWRVTQELLYTQPPPTIAYSATPAGAAMPPAPQPTSMTNPAAMGMKPNGVSSEETTTVQPDDLTPIQRLFTCKDGITLSALSKPNARPPPPANYYGVQQQKPRPIVKYNLDLTAQCRAVDDAMERIGELLADCMEYKERLEEARERIADVSRARQRVWNVIKERAGQELDRLPAKESEVL